MCLTKLYLSWGLRKMGITFNPMGMTMRSPLGDDTIFQTTSNPMGMTENVNPMGHGSQRVKDRVWRIEIRRIEKEPFNLNVTLSLTITLTFTVTLAIGTDSYVRQPWSIELRVTKYILIRRGSRKAEIYNINVRTTPA